MTREEKPKFPGDTRAGRYGPGYTLFEILLLTAAGLLASGCSTMYQEARSKMPPDPCARLELRIDEARSADRLLTRAVDTLRGHVQSNSAKETIQSALDRVDMQAFDLQRRALEAADAAALCKNNLTAEEEINRLRQHASTWLDYVQSAQNASTAEQASRLAVILHESAGSAPGQ